MAVVSTIRNRVKDPDQVCADAVDVARQALAGETGVMSADTVGDHVGVEAVAARVVTHYFSCTDQAYAGWRWAVTVTRAPRSKLVTVDESVLLPGPDALLAPAWVPWHDRLRPGDVGIGDLLPASPDDERLVPFAALDYDDDLVADWFQPRTDAENADAGPLIAEEVPSPGRSRVLSAFGRDDTADRWYSGDHGPEAALAHAAPARCVSCGFLIPLSGSLGRVFGACGNAYAPDDGRVVSADHGCGAHSEAATGVAAQAAVPVIDEFGYDMVDLPGVSVEETVFEPLSRDTLSEDTVLSEGTVLSEDTALSGDTGLSGETGLPADS